MMKIVHSPQSIVHSKNTPTSYEPRATSCILAALFLACLILPLSAQAATYYVSFTTGNDNNPGTEIAPFRTIHKGIDTANAGDKIFVVTNSNYMEIQRVGTASRSTDYKYLKKGLLDVTIFGADPTGQKDSTQAIQNAVIAARDYQLAAFFPNQANGERGIYLISDTIKCMKYETGGPCVLLGATKGKGRPIIKLQSNVSRFSYPSDPVPLIWFWAIPAHWMPDGIRGNQDPHYSEDDVSFNQIFKGIDIDLSGNPGAFGIRNPGAQGAAIEDTKINATGAFAGLGKFGVLGCATYNVEVDGGRYAVWATDYGDQLSIMNGHGVMIGCTFKNQETAVFLLSDTYAPIILAGFHIIRDQAVPVNQNVIFDEIKGKSVFVGNGGISLVDGVIEMNGGQIFNDAENFHMRNVYVKGADSVANGWNIDDKANWSWIKDYVFIGGYSQNIIDGNLNTNEIRDKVEGLNISIHQLVSSLVNKHFWDEKTFPSFEDADAVDVKEMGVNSAQGDGIADDTAALQYAIDHYGKIFLSKGVYRISSTLELKDNTQLFGVTNAFSKIHPASSWKPSGEAIILTTVDDKDARTLLAFLSVDNEWYEIPGQGGFTPIEWRAGRNSMTRNVVAGEFGDYSHGDDIHNNFHRVRINKGGGGKHFGLLGSWSFMANENSRGLLIENTAEPLHIYAFNAAMEPRSINVEIKNSQNVNLYGFYSEDGDTAIRIDKSENICVFTGNKNNDPGNYRGGIEVFDSNNVLVSNYAFSGMGHPKYSPNPYSLKEIFAGVETIIDFNKANIALYKRGDPGFDSLILFGDVSGDGEVSAYDAALTAQAAVGLITLTTAQTQAAEVSGDGKVTAYDAALIAERAVGLITKFPVEG